MHKPIRPFLRLVTIDPTNFILKSTRDNQNPSRTTQYPIPALHQTCPACPVPNRLLPSFGAGSSPKASQSYAQQSQITF